MQNLQQRGESYCLWKRNSCMLWSTHATSRIGDPKCEHHANFCHLYFLFSYSRPLRIIHWSAIKPRGSLSHTHKTRVRTVAAALIAAACGPNDNRSV